MINSHAGPHRAYDDFSLVLDPDAYEPLPDDWLIGITDVVSSTAAIRSGRYEDVNYAGASIIAALGNARGSFDFPFVFRGDGAAFALPANGIMAATSALRDVASFAKAELHLELRVGLVTVGEIRAKGRDVRIARYAASESATYAMFAGGGLKWAEQQIKNGRFLVKPGRYAMRPDLTGLSCDWAPFPSQRGEILSLLVEPRDQTRPEVFAVLAKRVLAVFDAAPRRSHPLSGGTAMARGQMKQVSAKRWSEVASNSDFRKFDDGLRLTLDCAPGQIDRVEAILIAARARGEIDFGLHRQSHALMTCLVPSGQPDSHLHFLDGMGGGYAKAAEMMEEGALAEVRQRAL
ncbi:adenylate cyclase protein [Rhizobium etli CIAT 652]|uniref:Adenylate cyclase protein n=1 Tax=Rhizobium etli (strain CIAT 652) TaxID=491916 RepID=B3PRP2_RHIE6|nr:adenylate cyclase protein [Rhizobium etli CIAT 652]